MIAGEDEILLPQGEGHVVGAMARGCDGRQGPAGAADGFSVRDHDVRPEIHVRAGIQGIDLADSERARRAVCPLCNGRGAGRGLDRLRGGGMIAMGMGDDDMADALAPHRVEDGRNVRGIVRPRIDDGHGAAAHDVGACAGEGKRRGVRRHDAPDKRRHLIEAAGRDIEAAVESDIVAHGLTLA